MARSIASNIVNGHPKNTRRGLQTVAAFGVLADVATGYPRLLADMTLGTAFRTAAVSALAARYLARPESETMALIGLGAQSEFQACAFQAALGVNRLRIHDVDPAAAEKFLRNMADSGFFHHPLRERARSRHRSGHCHDDHRGQTKGDNFSDNMVGAGTHLNAVGGDCPGKTELARDILLRAEIFVEYAPQTRLEGEIQQLSADHPVTELWEVVAGRKPGRRSRRAITIFDAVGFAIEDFSVLRLLRDLADELEIDDEIDLIARPDDPKNLFALLRAPQTERSRQWA